MVLEGLASAIPGSGDGRCALVAVDGPDGAGKTRFANALAEAVQHLGRPCLRISADDFLNVRALRYRRGRDSPDGFWLDSYNYPRLVDDVLHPLPTTGRYRPVAYDLATDTELDPPWSTAPPQVVVILDGLFLHRDELVQYWDFSVFLDVPFEVTARRMADRDGTNPDPEHPSMRRYVEGQRLYFGACSPSTRATVVIDNSDYEHPVLQERPR